MRRTHLRGHENILKRLLIHAGGFNVGLLGPRDPRAGTPRGLQGRLAAVVATLFCSGVILDADSPRSACRIGFLEAMRARLSPTTLLVNSPAVAACTTGC